jgi:4-amino-4-deoxy-L-arabinose transferase-like glycosyltransferase
MGVQVRNRNDHRIVWQGWTESRRVALIVVLVALSIVVLTSLFFLTRFPPVFIDEPWYANTAWNWLQTGVNIDSMHAEARPYPEWPYLGNLPLAAVFSLFGVGLFQARSVSWFFGILLLVATVLAGRRSYALTTGMLAALFLALSPPFLQASHYARPDIMLATIMMAAYALTTKGLFEETRWPHVVAGFLVTLSLDVHLNAAVFVFGFGALYLMDYGKTVLRRPGTWLFVFGAFIGFAIYCLVHFDPSQDFFGILPTSFALSNTHQPPVLTLSLVNLLRSAKDEIGRYRFYENGLDFAVIGASMAVLAVRRTRADRLLLVFVAATFLGFVLIVGAKHDIYAILLYPFFMLMVAESLLSLIRGSRSIELPRVFAGALLVLFVVSSTLDYARTLYESRDYDYIAITQRLQSSVAPAARVMGMPYWWLGFVNSDFRSSLNLTYYHYFQGLDLEEALSTMRPDYLIVDDGFSALLVNEGYYPVGVGFNAYLLPRLQFKEFMGQRARQVDQFEDPWHGWITVYAIDWSKSSP